MHRRSEDKLRKKLNCQLIFTNTFQYRQIVETICKLSHLEVTALLSGGVMLISLKPRVLVYTNN
jgi:hypothetical protein